MTKVSIAELKKLAVQSHIALQDDEIDELQSNLEALLTYAECVKQLSQTTLTSFEIPSGKTRTDCIVLGCSAELLAQAPEHEAHYFVVPRILESN